MVPAKTLKAAAPVALAVTGLWAARVATVAFGSESALEAAEAWITAAFIAAVLAARSRGALGRFGALRSSLGLDAPRVLLLVVGAITLESAHSRIGSDGIEHYAMARSILFDGDLRLENDVTGLRLSVVFRAEDGRVIARGPFGQSLLWMPVVAAADLIVRVARGLGASVPRDGFSPPYHIAVTTASFLMGFLGLMLIERFLRLALKPWASLAGALALLWATPLHFYLVSNPSLSHAAQVCLMAILVTLWRAARDGDVNRESVRLWAFAGLAGGGLGLLRSQDFFLLVPIGLDALFRRGGWRALAAFSPGVVAGGLLQLSVWRELFGPEFFRVMMSFNNVAPGDPETLNILFSPRHGFLSWTPLFVVALFGLVLNLMREPRFSLVAWLMIGLSVVANAQFIDWWASDSFGQRRLLGLLPLLGIGLGRGLRFAIDRPLLPVALVLASFGWWNNNLEYIHNSEMAVAKTEPLGFEESTEAQLRVTRRSLLSLDGRVPPRLFDLLWDHWAGGFLDDPGRVFEIGAETSSLAALEGSWSTLQGEGRVFFRTLDGRRAELRAPLRGPGRMEVTINVRGRATSGVPPVLEVFFADESVFRSEVPADWKRFAMTASLDSARRGVNRIRFVSEIPGSIDIDWLRVERR